VSLRSFVAIKEKKKKREKNERKKKREKNES
jgi:hypothetical protein